MSDSFENLYDQQVANQVSHFSGIDPAEMFDLNPHEHIQFVHWNFIAAASELNELIDEFSWKPWSANYAGARPSATRVAGEIADILCFISNLARAAGLSADELLAAWEMKIARNRERQEAGYDVSHPDWKCATCGKALDDDGVECTPDRCAS